MKLRSASRSKRAPASLIVRPASRPASSPPPTGRLRDAAVKIGVLGSGAAIAGLAAMFGPAGWRSAFITLTCTMAMLVLIAISDAPAVLAHPVRWVRVRLKGSALPAGSPQYTAFPLERFLTSLRTAQHVAILDTRLFLLDDEYEKEFVTALIGAIGRGARAKIVVLCPCSDAMKRRAKDLGEPYDAVKKAAERTIIMLDELCQDLGPAADRLSVWLTPSLPTQTFYRCDERVFSAILPPGGPSHREPHFEYSLESPYGQLGQSNLEQAQRRGTRLERHMRGELKAITDSGVVKVEGLRYIEHDNRLFVVVLSPGQVVTIDQSQGGSWRHGKHTWRGFAGLSRVDPATNTDLHTLLAILAKSKYGKAVTIDNLDCVYCQVMW